MQLFVLGMHRSGTSAVTRLLNMAGAYFGPEGISNGADVGNPKGHWERRDVRAACDAVLHDSGFDWWKVASYSLDAIPPEHVERFVTSMRTTLLDLDAHRPWVVKEPRLCLLFPLLRATLEVPVCIHVVREPLEVAASLQERNGFSMAEGLALWEVYTRSTFIASKGLPRVLVRYGDLLEDPTGEFERLVEQLKELGVRGLLVPGTSELQAFLSPNLHRQRRSADLRPAWLNAEQMALADAVASDAVLSEPPRLNASEAAVEVLTVMEQRREVERVKTELLVKVQQLEARGRKDESSANDSRKAIDALRRELDELVGAREHAECEAQRLDARACELARALEITRRHGIKTSDLLERAEDEIRRTLRSRTWRFTKAALTIRSGMRTGSPKPLPIDRALGRVEQARSEMQRLAETEVSLGESPNETEGLRS